MAPKLIRLGKQGRKDLKKITKTDERTTGFEYIRRVGKGAPKKK